MDNREVTWVHLPDKAPHSLTETERTHLETAIWLNRTTHPMGKRFAKVFQHAIAACLELVIWERGRSQREYIRLPANDPKPLSPLMRERLEGIIWILRLKKGSSLALHIEGILEETTRMALLLEPSSEYDKTSKVVDFDKAIQKKRDSENGHGS